jgi:hypothetical protein
VKIKRNSLFADILLVLVFLVFLTCTATAGVEELSISNKYLQVIIEPQRDIFSVKAMDQGKIFLRQGRFASGIRSVEKKIISDSLWGPGEEIIVSHDNDWQSTLRLFKGNPFLQIHTSVYNSGSKPYVVASQELLRFEADLGLPAEKLKSFGTGFLSSLEEGPGSFSFTALVDPGSRKGIVAACLTHDRGSGVFFTEVKDKRPHVRFRMDFGRYQVDPGKSRKTETLLIGYFNDARLGLEAYADSIARQYAIELKPQPSVYCTWYHARGPTEEMLIANGEFAKKHLKPFGFSVVQIDDHWQAKLAKKHNYTESQMNFKEVGPVKVFFEAIDDFPGGMEQTAQKLKELGLVPGIWFMPFAGTWNNPYFADKQDLFARWPDGTAVVSRWSGSLLDMSNPKTQAFVYNRVKRIADWGYEYFKLDGMHTGAVTHNVYVNTSYSTSGTKLNTQNFVGNQTDPPMSIDEVTPSTVLNDPRMTHIEAYRKGLQIVRDAAPNVFILGCNVSQNMRSMGGAFGLIDAMRIGPDNGGAGNGKWSSVMAGPRHGSNLYFLNRRVWHNDPDPIFVRPSTPINSARLMASWVAVSGSMLTTSYQFSELPAERLDILKRCMPGHRAQARPVDLFESNPARIWLLTDSSSPVSRNVIGLFNWKESESETIVYDMDKLGLDAEIIYTAFDYWADKFAEPIHGTLKQTLPPASCRVLALRPAADHPQLISTSRHITQGVIDVLEERWDNDKKILSGKSLVVAGDPYEMRIALPEEESWKVEKVFADGADIKLLSQTEKGIRVLLESPKNGLVKWSIHFKQANK